MTRITKRLLALLMALLVSVAAFAGCDAFDDGGSEGSRYEENDDTESSSVGGTESESETDSESSSASESQTDSENESSSASESQTDSESESSSASESQTDLESESSSTSESSSETESDSEDSAGTDIPEGYEYASVDGIPDYSGSPYAVLNGNIPEFKPEEIVSVSYETYAELDSLGRCGVTVACVGQDIMPTEDRESISSVKPSGWINKKYDTSLVDGGYIYNRCHLIGFQLTGENANKQNLITGTRYMNVDGMLPFENMVADYVKETGNHVMYRITPIFVGDNLVASGVQMEAWSVEDNGEGICFNVFTYNVQPGIVINYKTGDSLLSGEALPETSDTEASESETEKSYVLNTNTKKIHKPECSSATSMNQANRQDYTGLISDLLNNGYTKCGTCKPD